MKFYHYSDRRTRKFNLRPRTQEKDELSPYHKPRGLWISPDEEEMSWPEWCSSEGLIHWIDQKRYRVDVDLENVRVLKSVGEIEEFTEEFELPRRLDPPWDRYVYIDWPKITKIWDGLIITPYQWSIRLVEKYNWYYPWDCASGCIWEPRAVKRIYEVRNPWAVNKYPREKRY